MRIARRYDTGLPFLFLYDIKDDKLLQCSFEQEKSNSSQHKRIKIDVVDHNCNLVYLPLGEKYNSYMFIKIELNLNKSVLIDSPPQNM